MASLIEGAKSLNRKIEDIRTHRDGVTVIIGIKDRDDYRIINSLKSIRNQDYPREKISIILVDYGSKINFSEKLKVLCSEYAAQYQKVKNVDFWNRSHALNVGIKKSHSKYILCSDSDIVFEKNYISTCVREIRKNPRSLLYRKMLDTKKNSINKKIDVIKDYSKIRPKASLRETEGKFTYTFGLSINFTERKNYLEVNGYDEFYHSWGFEDDDLIKRFKQSGIKIIDIGDKSSYLHQWHEKYEGLTNFEKENTISKNQIYFQSNNRIFRNRKGFGSLSGPSIDTDDKIIHDDSDLAVVTCHFNPCHYKRRVENYRLFREGIKRARVPLLTIELAFGDDAFELSEFPEVLQIRTSRSNIMWQKERLLNIGIKKLIKENYKKIAWFDADILFESNDWPKRISKLLDKHEVCHVFSEVEKFSNENDKGIIAKSSVLHYYKTGELKLKKEIDGGHGWAANSKILNKFGLYDKAILGGGDTLIFLACYFYNYHTKTEIMKSKHLSSFLSQDLIADYLIWARKWGWEVRGNVGFLDEKIKSLYHGSVINREYIDRLKIFKKYIFFPRSDLGLDENQIYYLKDKSMSGDLMRYFFSRKEDE